jgi:hypothetical protein
LRNGAPSEHEQHSNLIRECWDDPGGFNHAVLGRKNYWAGQIEIAESVLAHRTTLVQAGNLVGKTYVLAGILLWYLYTRDDAIVISTAPTQTQLEEVLWKEVRSAWRNSKVPLDGRLLADPQKIALSDTHFALGYSTTKTERLSGHHANNLLVIVDEFSGIDPEIVEALDSLDAHRTLAVGNPIRPDGAFYERCVSAHENPHTNLLIIPSTDSPDIELERSPRGLASRTWLESVRADYGEGSHWWLSHVLAQFPGSVIEAVILPAWLDVAAQTRHRRAGPARIAIDLGEGGGGDQTVIIVRDDNGILAIEYSRHWNLETTATKAALLAQRFNVPGWRVSWDAGGIGSDFLNRLEAVGLHSANPYRGGSGGNAKFANTRTSATWALRKRLDPKRMIPVNPSSPVLVPQPPFAIAPAHVALMRRELQALRYGQDEKNRVILESKESLIKRLKHSPDFADALAQSFAYSA